MLFVTRSRADGSTSSRAKFMATDYLHMMWHRIDLLRLILQMGYSFVFTDTDIMWLRDPFPRFCADADFQIACDFFNGNPTDKENHPNGGFNYASSACTMHANCCVGLENKINDLSILLDDWRKYTSLPPNETTSASWTVPQDCR
ncbi:hypothetical protein MLD38_028118 [Melastoma candidum]|uniref:Uncharacterized protein n=1 Tax=Melastoma candidum TaxID=119954 RepID=A0ACB9MZX9_9MYRT|nr:hypothetical protein MLD38_028118 [Melastoma candidum]